MLLNIIKGPRNFAEIRISNGIVYKTYQEACYALGLLDNDKEWHDAILKASNWASRKQLRELFVTILMLCEVVDPSNQWKLHWKIFSEDILHIQRCILKHNRKIMPYMKLKNYFNNLGNLLETIHKCHNLIWIWFKRVQIG